jgi:hypothetical protein
LNWPTLLRHSPEHIRKPEGSAVWLRVSTRALAQPERTIDPAEVIAGAHWVVKPADRARCIARFCGTALIVRSGSGHDEIGRRLVQPEKDRDPEKKGYAVLIKVERAEDLEGLPLEG